MTNQEENDVKVAVAVLSQKVDSIGKKLDNLAENMAKTMAQHHKEIYGEDDYPGLKAEQLGIRSELDRIDRARTLWNRIMGSALVTLIVKTAHDLFISNGGRH